MNRPLRVFLCHSSQDKPTVRELYQKLRAESWIQPWLDEEELFPGMDWNLEIEKAIEETDVIIVCLSKGSTTKEGYVQKEIKTALDYSEYKPEGTIFIIPIRLEDCKLPSRLAKWQYADYFEDQRGRIFQKLIVSLRERADTLSISSANFPNQSGVVRVNNQLHLFKFCYNEKGELVLSDKELLAVCAELLFAIESNEEINVDIEFSQIKEFDRWLESNKDKNVSPDLRISRIEILKLRKTLFSQRQLLIRGVNLALRDPILPFLQMKSRRLALVLQGFGKLLFEDSVVTHDTVLLDIWHKENRRISAVIRVFPNNDEERDYYHTLIGDGWDLYHIGEYSKYARAVPAIILEYLHLLDNNQIEDSKNILDLYKWNVGLR